VGDSVTLVTPAKGLSAEEFKKKFAAWQKAVATVSKEMSESADEAKRSKAQQEFQKLYQQRGEFMKEDRTGFVWLYLRK
jgi:wobble nucleotide-excising tRNase